MKRPAVFFIALLAFASDAEASYRYTYVPKTVSPTVYSLLYSRKEKCSSGEKVPYPGQKHGACVSCPRGSYMIDETAKKAGCFVCPEGTLTALSHGLPVCLSLFPVTDGKAKGPKGRAVKREEIARMVSGLGADYKTGGLVKQKSVEEEKTFRKKAPLRNVCPSLYPDDPRAERQTEICKRLAEQNDFLCPYVEQGPDGQWLCRACPKNAPYKGENGGCFTCPYGEEMVSLPDGRSVCASDAPKPEKKILPPKKGKKASPKAKKSTKRPAKKRRS